MQKKDMPKSIALVLVLLTVVISAATTWLVIDRSFSSEPLYSEGSGIIALNIRKGESLQPGLKDSNSADVKLNIVKNKGG